MSDQSSILKFRLDSSRVELSSGGKHTSEWLKKSLRPFSFRFVILFLLSGVYCATYVVLPRIFGEIIDVYVSLIIESLFGETASKAAAETVPLLGVAAAVLAVNALSGMLQGVDASGITASFAHSLRKNMFCKINSLPMAYIDTRPHGEILSRQTESVDELTQSLSLWLTENTTSLLSVIGTVAMMLSVDLKMSAVTAAFVAVALILLSVNGKAGKRLSEKTQSALSVSGRATDEYFEGLRVLQLSGKIPQLLAENEKSLRNSRKAQAKAGFVAALSACSTEFIMNLCLVFVTVIGAFRAAKGDFSVGLLMTTLMYIRRISQPLSRILDFSSVKRGVLSAAERIRQFMLEKEAVSGTRSVPECGDIEFCNIDFVYPAGNIPVLKNANLTVKSSGITVFSGETGAGKSTLTKLMLNFYQPQSGSIYYGGEDISTLDLREYRSRFSVIPQEAALFEDTIAANIAYGCPDADFAAIRQAAEMSGASRVIERLEKGYDTVFSANPQNLSNGEIQLILLARALMNKSKVIIFDEATSFLDAKSESRIKDVLRKIAKNTCVIIITHRSSVIDFADVTVTVENGECKI